MKMKRVYRWSLAALALLLGVGGFWQQWRLREEASLTLRGETMGTTFSVRVAGRLALAPEALRGLIEERLRQVNASMSTWDAKSELSRINAAPAHAPLRVSADLGKVLTATLELARASGGTFDPTVGPLVNLWGFGPERQPSEPTAAAIAEARERTGYRHLRLEGDLLTKEREGLYVDLSAIAKGFGVDEVARVLEAQGITRYVVEIGGELVARGRNSRGLPWAIGIERPDPEAPPGEAAQAVVRLERGALATSGTYRRFRRTGQSLRHHIIDPRTGYPTPPPLVEVTVYAPDCMTADGIATALVVLGAREGMDWLQGRPGVEALFVEESPPGTLLRHVSRGFPPLETGE